MKVIASLICGWIVCGAAAVWVIVSTRELMWGNLPWWFSLSWDVFLLFVAFALPAKIVILVCDLTSHGDR